MFDIEKIIEFYRKDTYYTDCGKVVIEALYNVENQTNRVAYALNMNDFYVNIDAEEIADCFIQVNEEYGENCYWNDIKDAVIDKVYNVVYMSFIDAINSYLTSFTTQDGYGRPEIYMGDFEFVYEPTIIEDIAKRLVDDYHEYC